MGRDLRSVFLGALARLWRAAWPAQDLPVCIVVIPCTTASSVRRPLADVATVILARVRELATVVFGPEVALLGVLPGGRELIPLSGGSPIDCRILERSGSPFFLANASYLLVPDPPYLDLLERARQGATVLVGDRARDELYAVALAARRRSRPPLAEIVSRLTACRGRMHPFAWGAWSEAPVENPRACDTRSPAVEGVVPLGARPSALAPGDLNTALAELVAEPADPAPVHGEPERVCEALLAQRDRSQVPWVFNLLANELEYAAGRAEMASLPPEAHLSLTSACNIECRFCTYTHEGALYDGVTLDEVRRLDFLKHLHTFRLTSGLGEPTLNPHLPEIVEYLADAHPHLRTNFFTNGLALGRERLIEALVGRTTWINVSLNAATRETWRAVCGEDGFERVCGSLRGLHVAKRARGSVHPLVFSSLVVTRKNIHDLPIMPERCRELGIDRFTAIPFFALVFGSPGKYGPADTLESCRAEYDALYPDILRSAQEHRVSVELPLPSPEKCARFGLELRRYHDFASIGHEDPGVAGTLVRGVLGDGPREQLCHWIWRIALIGKTSRAHVAPARKTHLLYPCLGPLVSVDFSDRTPFDFPGRQEFQRLWNSPHFVFLRWAQQRPGACAVCDICRHADTRDPSQFAGLNSLLKEWQPSRPQGTRGISA